MIICYVAICIYYIIKIITNFVCIFYKPQPNNEQQSHYMQKNNLTVPEKKKLFSVCSTFCTTALI